MRMVVGIMVLGQLLTRLLLAAHAGDRLAAARRILRDVPLIDGHNDLPWNIRKFLKNQLRDFRFDDLRETHPWSRSAWSHTDLRRLREGMVAAQFLMPDGGIRTRTLDSMNRGIKLASPRVLARPHHNPGNSIASPSFRFSYSVNSTGDVISQVS